MPEHSGEHLLDRCEPIEDADLLLCIEANVICPIHNLCHLTQKVFPLRGEIALIKIIQSEEIFEGNILEVRTNRTVKPYS